MEDNMEDNREAIALLQTFVGRVVRSVAFNCDSDGTGQEFELTLDDGRTVVFGGWGHDWCGGLIYEVEGLGIATVVAADSGTGACH